MRSIAKTFWCALIACVLLSAASAAQGPAQVAGTVDSASEVSTQKQTQAGQGTILYFPDYVVGGGWSVQLVVGNLDPDNSARVDVETYDDQGRRVSRFFNSGTQFDLPPQGSRVLKSAGTGAVRRGWIEVRSSAGSVKGLLTYRDTQSGIEVGVAPIERRDEFALFVEESSEIGTGLAIFKPDAAAEIEFQIRDESGSDPLGAGLTIGGFQQQARTLPEWFDKMGVTFRGDFRGLLFLRSGDASSFAPLGLRFGKQKASLSAVPVIPFLDEGGDGRPPNPFQPTQPDAASLYFPDYVDGAGWSVQLVLGNLDPVRRVTVDVEVYDQQGQPVRGLFASGTRFELPAQGSRILRSGGGTRIRRGWIQVEPDSASVRGLLVYRHAETGIEVGVAPINPRDQFALFVEESIEIGTGLALFKPEAAPEIELEIRNESGRDPVGQVLTFGNFQQQALTLPEWFQEVDTTFLRDFRGMLFVRSKDGSSFAPLGLRFGKRQGSLSAVPVIPILDEGRSPGGSPPPTVTLSASPEAIEQGGSSTLTWSSTNAVSATLTPGIGSVPTSGSRTVSPTATTTYRITVQNAAGRTAAAEATITVTGAPQGDRAVLVALYEATDGPNWVDADNWLTEAPLGDWLGVAVDGQGRVIQLDLRENNLVGRIPTELGDLAQLQILDLRENQLTGMIPVELSQLSQLETLYLMDNRLTGTIPWELSRLSRLQRLGLYINRLTGAIPVELSRLSQLQWLYLGWNQLTGAIPVELSRLSQLERLFLNNNQLTGAIPEELSRLSQLEQLGLMDNRLTGEIPGELSGLSQLQSLFLDENQLTGKIPVELSRLSQLLNLGLGNNRLTGEIPAELSRLSQLWSLDLDNNRLTGEVPGELGDLANLHRLWINQNQLEGTIPSSFLRLDRLGIFHFGENQGLCVPKTTAFTEWLEGIEKHSGPYCDSGGRKVYWTDWGAGRIQRANLDGTGVESLVSGLKGAASIALDLGTGRMYWTATEASKIQRANLDGSGVEDLVSGLSWPRGIALDLGAGKMYWTDAIASKIQRANLDGTGVETVVSGLDDPNDIALDLGMGKMYWTSSNGHKIQRANLDGTSVEDIISGLNNPLGIALDLGAGKMYWTDNQTRKIHRANLSGTGVENLLSSPGPDGIALDLDAGKMYWTDPAFTTKIQRANLDGSGVEDVVTGLSTPLAIALDLGNQGGTGGGDPPPTVSLSASPNSIERGGSARLTWSSTNAVSATITPGIGTVPTSGSRTVSPTTTTTYRITVRDAAGRTAAAAATVTVTVSDVDRAALVALYNATDGPNWTRNDNWLTSAPLDQWFGVTTDANGRVTELRFFRNALSGSFPSELGTLSNLESLSVYDNDLSGSLPRSMGNLRNLRVLSLALNQFSGSLPTWLGNLPNLRVLSLGNNRFSGTLPTWLGNLTNLEWLSLGENDFSGSLPSSLGNLTNLRHLWIPGLRLSGALPSWLGNLTNLRDLWLSNNRFSGVLPSWLGSLTNLRELTLNDNDFSGALPSWLGNLTNLRLLYLDNNDFSGALPSSLTNLTNLEWLVLENTQLCAPTDAAFQTWLQSIENKRGVVNCASGARKIYWTERSLRKIQRSNLDGSNVEDLVVGSEYEAIGIALDVGGDKMYWTNIRADKIQRSNLDGSNVEDLVALNVSNSSGPWNIALDVDGGKMYWTYRTSGTNDKIQRSNLDGSNVEDLITTGLQYLNGIALDVGTRKMYWVDEGTDKIQRSNFDGSNVEDLIGGLSSPWGIALDVSGGKIYWADQGADKIQRSNLDGSNVEDFITGLNNPIDIALDLGGGKMYWIGASGSTSKIQRSNLDGSNVEDVVTGLRNPWGIALEISR